jgi:DNA polymerase III delta prime subunit
MAMQQFGKIVGTQESVKEVQKETQKAIQESREAMKKTAQGLEESNQKILNVAEKNLETAKKALQTLEQLSQKQGTGEITLFYPIGESKLGEKSLEYRRLVEFIDFLARESKGRKVLLVSIGSASAVGKKSLNMKLAQMRAEYPRQIIDKYLINIPHDYYRVYGIGDLYSPKTVSRNERDRYQHTRLIAVFETDQIPALPEEPAKK